MDCEGFLKKPTNFKWRQLVKTLSCLYNLLLSIIINIFYLLVPKVGQYYAPTDFSPREVVVITWDTVGYFDMKTDKVSKNYS